MTLAKQKKHNTVVDAVGCDNYSDISERRLKSELKDIPDEVINNLIEINIVARDGKKEMERQLQSKTDNKRRQYKTVSSIKTKDGRTLVFVNEKGKQKAVRSGTFAAATRDGQTLSVHEGQARKLRRKFLINEYAENSEKPETLTDILDQVVGTVPTTDLPITLRGRDEALGVNDDVEETEVPNFDTFPASPVGGLPVDAVSSISNVFDDGHKVNN
jgi:hypothetical protein